MLDELWRMITAFQQYRALAVTTLDSAASKTHAFDEWTDTRVAFHQTYKMEAHSSNE
jgi:hypothetical protein